MSGERVEHAGETHPVTIQQTSKVYKSQMLIGAGLFFIGIVVLFVAPVAAHGSEGAMRGMVVGILAAIVGALWFIGAWIVGWWHHG
jgi:uncharacterized membrane-anchored protein